MARIWEVQIRTKDPSVKVKLGSHPARTVAKLEENKYHLTRSFTVWASHKEIASVLQFPKLEDPSAEYADAGLGTTLEPWSNYTGQAGWDIGINFNTLSDLRTEVKKGLKTIEDWHWPPWKSPAPVGEGEISRLAIQCHGHYGGLWFPNGRGYADQAGFPAIAAVEKTAMVAITSSAKDDTSIKTDSVKMQEQCLKDIGAYTSKDATILLMGCLAGDGPGGTALLMELSRIWPGRTIVAFATMGSTLGWRMRVKKPFYYAGMKDTGRDTPSFSEQEIFNEWDTLPWASENCLSAKIVKDDKVLKWPIVRRPVQNPKHLNSNEKELKEEPHYLPTLEELNRAPAKGG
jgi:hypothetical protein